MGLRVGSGLKIISDSAPYHVLSEAERKRMHELLHEIALDIYAFCDVFGLTVMLSGGSCLGAIRHGGFIPWDDDMDLNMPRADYDVFIREFPRLFVDKYSVQIPGITPGCASRVTQVHLKGTVARDFNDIDNEEPGLFVDVFPIENVPDNAVIRKIHGLASMATMYVHSCRRYHRFRKQYREIAKYAAPELSRTIETKIKIGRLFAPFSCEFMARVMDAINSACKDDTTQFVTIPLGKFYFEELCNRSVHTPASIGVFEGIEWKLPGNPKAYLEMLYGDYMRVPEESQREHHYFMEFDLGKYTNRTNSNSKTGA